MKKYIPYKNLAFLVKLLIVYIIICVKSYADTNKIKPNFVTIGNEDSPVKIKVFSSLTCPHCADFHIKVLPKIKEDYVKKNLVQLILIDFPLDQAGFNASKLTYCVDEKKQMSYLDTVYENQSNWTAGSNIDEINDNLKKIVKSLGISSVKFNECLNNDDISDKILNGRIENQKKYSINSTPSIIINDVKLKDSANFENIKKKIEKLI